MNGTRFVALLAVLAIVAVAAITLGLPTWGASEDAARDETADPSRSSGDGIGDGPDVAVAPDTGDAPRHPPIDRGSTVAADSAAGWSYRRTTVADLDADAVPERLVIASDVFVTGDGEPMWGDSHRWALYAEEDDGARTLLYSSVAPPGGVAVGVGSDQSSGARRIVVIEQSRRSARLLLVVYEGPGRTRLLDEAGADVEAWVDRVAEEAE